MAKSERNWRADLETIDRTMRAISDMTDPEELVARYWQGIGELVPSHDYVALSRRDVEPPWYLITRSSRVVDPPNPWTQRHLIPRVSGGILGDIAYAERPVIIDNLDQQLDRDDPGWFHLQGYERLVSFPQYESGQALNVSILLFAKGAPFDGDLIPSMHWQNSLFGRSTRNLVLRNQLTRAHDALDAEIKVVADIQRSLLPARLPDIPGYDLAAYYQTSARAGGDYYDVFRIDDRRSALIVADVSGHGTPAAVLMAMVRALAHARPDLHGNPTAFMTWINGELTRGICHDGSFVTAFYAVLDHATGRLSHTSAGHNPPRLVHAASQTVHGLDSVGGLPLGIDPQQTYVSANTPLEPGDIVLLYTDGITEAVAPTAAFRSRELFGTDRLDQTLCSCSNLSAHDFIQHVCAQVDTFTARQPATDDRTLVAIRRV